MFRLVSPLLVVFGSFVWVESGLSQQGRQTLGPLDVFESVQDPQLSPDGSRVLYVRQRTDIMSDRNYTNLWVVDVDGGNHRPLTTGDSSDSSSRWFPDGTHLAFTSVNADILAARSLGAVEEIRYPSERDGRQIQGWMVKPPDFDPNREYPLVLEIHGGPFANYGDRFDFEKQMMAARRYVVL